MVENMIKYIYLPIFRLKMSTIETNIPAFGMWKMFNDTVPVLIRGDCSESSVKRLAGIIQSKEFSNIFIYSQDPQVSFEQCQEIGEKYKAFTTWLLGHFFYLLGYDRFSKIHDIIIETQLSVLDQLSKTQVHIYHELAKEYHQAFDLLVNYYKEPHDKLLLHVFIPATFTDLKAKLDLTQIYIEISSKRKCILLIGKLMKFIKFILLENFLFFSFDDSTLKSLDAILYLMSVGDSSIKLDVIDIFLNIYSQPRHDFEEYDLHILKKFKSFSSLFEQYVYTIYNSEVELKNQDRNNFEILLIMYLQIKRDVNCVKRISNFIFSKCLETCNNVLPSINVLLVALKTASNVICGIDEKLRVINQTLNFSNSLPVHCFKQMIFDEIYEHLDEKSYLNVYQTNTCNIWRTIYERILENLKEIECKDTCNMIKFLDFFESITNMLLQIIVNFKKSNSSKSLCFFEEKDLLLHFLMKYNAHCNNCGNMAIKPDRYLKFFINLALVTNSKNIDIIFHFLAFPLLNPLCYKNISEFPENFIGLGSLGEIKKAIKMFYSYLSSQDVNRTTSLLYINEFFIIMSSSLINLNGSQVQQIEKLYTKICTNTIPSNNEESIGLVSKNIYLWYKTFFNVIKNYRYFKYKPSFPYGLL